MAACRVCPCSDDGLWNPWCGSCQLGRVLWLHHMALPFSFSFAVLNSGTDDRIRTYLVRLRRALPIQSSHTCICSCYMEKCTRQFEIVKRLFQHILFGAGCWDRTSLERLRRPLHIQYTNPACLAGRSGLEPEVGGFGIRCCAIEPPTLEFEDDIYSTQSSVRQHARVGFLHNIPKALESIRFVWRPVKGSNLLNNEVKARCVPTSPTGHNRSGHPFLCCNTYSIRPSCLLQYSL